MAKKSGDGGRIGRVGKTLCVKPDNEGEMVVVKVNGKVVATAPTSQDPVIEIECPSGGQCDEQGGIRTGDLKVFTIRV